LIIGKHKDLVVELIKYARTHRFCFYKDGERILSGENIYVKLEDQKGESETLEKYLEHLLNELRDQSETIEVQKNIIQNFIKENEEQAEIIKSQSAVKVGLEKFLSTKVLT